MYNWGPAVSGEIPASLSALTSLQFLFLWNNGFTGTLPDLSRLTQLTQVLAYDNRLSRMPSAYPPNLEQLWLNGNGMTGEIPDTIGSMPSLATLNLHSNRLTGRVPQEFGQLGSLRLLTLYNNSFSGALPQAFSALDLAGGCVLNDAGLCKAQGQVVSSTCVGLSDCDADGRPTAASTVVPDGSGQTAASGGSGSDDTGGGSGSDNTGLIVGLVVALFVAIVATVIGVYYRYRTRREKDMTMAAAAAAKDMEGRPEHGDPVKASVGGSSTAVSSIGTSNAYFSNETPFNDDISEPPVVADAGIPFNGVTDVNVVIPEN